MGCRNNVPTLYIGQSLGSDYLFWCLSESSNADVNIVAPERQKHHGALIAIAQIAEGCGKVMIKNLEPLVSTVLNSFQDAHPRVRWAVINAIGQLSTDLGSDLQNQYHQNVLPVFAGAMDDFQNPHVQNGISLVGMTVRKDKLKDDAEQVSVYSRGGSFGLAKDN